MKFQYIYQIEDFDNSENSKKYKKITELEIIDTSSYIQVGFKLDEEKEDKIENFFIKLNNNFKIIQINKENKEIYNIQDIIKNWKKIKKEAILGIDIPAIIDLVLDNSKYYENEEFLSMLLKNYNIMPFFFLVNLKDLSKTDSKNLSLYNIIYDSELAFTLSFSFEEEKNEKGILYFTGKEDSKVDTFELRKLIKEEYNVPSGKPFSLQFKIEGMYFLEKNTIQGFKTTIVIDSPKVMKKIITFELMELKNE